MLCQCVNGTQHFKEMQLFLLSLGQSSSRNEGIMIPGNNENYLPNTV